MGEINTPIQNVSDTALWVAHYRAVESQAVKPLFSDPLAQVLVGERGKEIAEFMDQSSPYTRYNVLLRTVVIDRFIQSLLAVGVDTVLNLGAGLDTRPYRLDLPANVKWIEVDFPRMIEFKNKRLENELPKCDLTRVALDLSDEVARRKFFSQFSGSVLVLTEGVLPYLKPEQVASLAKDLKSFRYWIADYISPEVYPYFRARERRQKMRNAPFQFYPDDWLGFFTTRGWKIARIEYLSEEGLKLGRPPPSPWWMKMITPFLSAEKKQRLLHSSAYMILERD